MSTISEVKARLLESGTPFKAVGGASALANVKDRPAGDLPQAFVLFVREASADNSRTMGKVLQRQERDLIVVTFHENVSDELGDAAMDDLEAIKAFVRGKLIGFLPTDMKVKISHVQGEVVEAVKGLVCFEDTFSAPTYLEEA